MLLRKESIPWSKVQTGRGPSDPHHRSSPSPIFLWLLTFEPTIVSPAVNPSAPVPVTNSRAVRLAPCVPVGVFASLFVITFKRWFMPFQDHAPEMMTPERLVHGEVLYRDVTSVYGPIPPYLDALALRLFGEHLDVLLGIRTLIAMLGIAALVKLTSRLVESPIAASALTSFIVATTFFGYGSSYVFPYSVAALEGTVGTWWALELALGSKGWRRSLAAALLAGLAAGTKLEYLPAALAGTGIALLWRRPRFEAAACLLSGLLLGIASFGLPVLFFGVATLRRHGFLIALDTPAPWRHFFNFVIFGSRDVESFLSTGLVHTIFPSALFLAAALGLLTLASSVPAAAISGAAFLAWAAVKIPGNGELHVLVPLAVVLASWDAIRVLRTRAFRDLDSAACARICLAASMLFVVWRQPFFITIPPFSAFASPLALAYSVSWLWNRAPARAAPAFTLLMAALCLAQTADRWRESRVFPMRWVSLPRASLFLPVESADFIEATVAVLDRSSRPDDFVCVFPEPGFLTFATRRRTPFIDEQFHAGCQDAGAEQEMIRRLRDRPIPIAFVTNRPLGFDGAEYRHGLLDGFFAEFDRRMKPIGFAGDPRRPIPGMGQATSAVVYVPREEARQKP